MQCRKCGREITEDSSFCPGCGSPVNPAQTAGSPAQTAGAPAPINTWLIPAVLATIFCCLPFGIVSIVFASRANSDISAGNYQQAQMNAAKAKTWFWVAFGVGFVTSTVWVIIQVILAVAAAD